MVVRSATILCWFFWTLTTPTSGQRTDLAVVVERINAILESDAVDSPPPRVSIEDGNLIVVQTNWDSIIPTVKRMIRASDIAAVSQRAINRAGEPAYFRTEIIIHCEDDRRCVRVLTPTDSLVGSPQRIRLTVWRDTADVRELTRLLRRLVQSFSEQPPGDC